MNELNNLKYYALQVDENKEYYIRKLLLQKFSKLVVFVPMIKKKTMLHNKSYFYYEKSMPEYLIIGAENLDKITINCIQSFPHVTGFLCEKIDTQNYPSCISNEEIKTFLNSIKKQKEIDDLLKKEVMIINGAYTGNAGIVKSLLDDHISVQVDINGKPKVKLTVWDIGREE